MQYTERTKTFSRHEDTNAEVVVVATVDAAAAAAVANGNGGRLEVVVSTGPHRCRLVNDPAWRAAANPATIQRRRLNVAFLTFPAVDQSPLNSEARRNEKETAASTRRKEQPNVPPEAPAIYQSQPETKVITEIGRSVLKNATEAQRLETHLARTKRTTNFVCLIMIHRGGGLTEESVSDRFAYPHGCWASDSLLQCSACY